VKEAASIVLILVATGKATAYREGLMEKVVENRLKWGHIDTSLPHTGYVALADKKYVGERVLLELPTGEWVGPLLVADCGAMKDQQHLVDIGFAIDLSYPLAVKYLKNPRTPLHGVKVWLISDGNTGGNENGD
jgi:hypothetical protein